MSQKKNKFQINFESSKISWLKSGGKISKLLKITNEQELLQIKSSENFDKNKTISVGNFSNCLIKDRGFDGLCIKLIGDYSKISIKHDHIIAGAGVLDSFFSQFC